MPLKMKCGPTGTLDLGAWEGTCSGHMRPLDRQGTGHRKNESLNSTHQMFCKEAPAHVSSGGPTGCVGARQTADVGTVWNWAILYHHGSLVGEVPRVTVACL